MQLDVLALDVCSLDYLWQLKRAAMACQLGVAIILVVYLFLFDLI